ncbi:hypothetical protein BDW75DRAFT_238092 [Aspergillus navahoensis]
MLPAFAPGDILFVTNHHRDVAIGDLPVCWLPGKALPMVHRVHRVMYGQSTSSPNPDSTHQQLILTKGDNNLIDDTLMYPDGQDFLPRRHVLGFVRGYVPCIGWIVIVLQEFTRTLEAAAVLCRGTGLSR